MVAGYLTPAVSDAIWLLLWTAHPDCGYLIGKALEEHLLPAFLPLPFTVFPSEVLHDLFKHLFSAFCIINRYQYLIHSLSSQDVTIVISSFHTEYRDIQLIKSPIH